MRLLYLCIFIYGETAVFMYCDIRGDCCIYELCTLIVSTNLGFDVNVYLIMT